MIKYTEMFYSVQGEGKFTGAPSVFLRLWGCGLNCHGFGQKDPMDSDTWELDFKEYDPKAHNITDVEQLPVWTKGCDSSYTWAPKYAYLAKKESAEHVADQMGELADLSKVHVVVTGGECLMPANQKALIELIPILVDRGLKDITFETNGTHELLPEFKATLDRYIGALTTSFSVSYKLQHVTGEMPCKTLKPESVNDYVTVADHLWLKPVVVDTDECWAELDETIAKFKEQPYLSEVPVYVMPCGATQEEQEQEGYMASIANKALARHYHVSVRMHVWVYGNAVGT